MSEPYQIRPYTYKRAKKLGVVVKQSKNKTKKIDVFDKKGRLLASVGARGMYDYPTYMAKTSRKMAEERRKLYKIRHKKDRFRRGTPGYYADQLLW